MFTHHSLLVRGGYPGLAAHLIQSPSIRPLPLRLSFTEGPRPELPYPCASSPWGLLALEVSHASRGVTSCFQILEGYRVSLRGTTVHAYFDPSLRTSLNLDFIRIVDSRVPSSLSV